MDCGAWESVGGPWQASAGLGCRALLKHMAPEHKFATTAKLSQDVLAGFADGALPLDRAPEVLRDCLNILASKDIKVCPAPTSFPSDRRLFQATTASASPDHLGGIWQPFFGGQSLIWQISSLKLIDSIVFLLVSSSKKLDKCIF